MSYIKELCDLRTAYDTAQKPETKEHLMREYHKRALEMITEFKQGMGYLESQILKEDHRIDELNKDKETLTLCVRALARAIKGGEA